MRRGLEGFVAKDAVSTYRAGRTRSWIKVKLRHERVFVVGGGRNVDAFDGVLVGEKDGGELLYRGVVEWGFKARDVLRLLRDARIFRQQTSPFADVRTMRNAVWMEPRRLAEISYAEIVDGRLRAPSWRGSSMMTALSRSAKGAADEPTQLGPPRQSVLLRQQDGGHRAIRFGDDSDASSVP